MGITFTEEGTNSSSSSSASLAVSGIDANAGDWLVVRIAADNAGTSGASSIASVSDSGGNTYTQAGTVNNDPSSANAGVTIAFFYAPVTSALSGGTVTVNFSPDTTAKTAAVHRIQPGTGEAISLIGAGTGGMVNNLDWWGGETTASMNTGDLVFGVLGIERGSITITGDSDTTNGSWVANTQIAVGSSTTGMNNYSQHKIVTGSGTQTWSGTGNATADMAWNHIIFRAIPVSIPRNQHQYRQRRV